MSRWGWWALAAGGVLVAGAALGRARRRAVWLGAPVMRRSTHDAEALRHVIKLLSTQPRASVRKIAAVTGVPPSTVSDWDKRLRAGRVPLELLSPAAALPPRAQIPGCTLTPAELRVLRTLVARATSPTDNTAPDEVPAIFPHEGGAEDPFRLLAPEVEDPDAERARIRSQAWERALALDAQRAERLARR